MDARWQRALLAAALSLSALLIGHEVGFQRGKAVAVGAHAPADGQVAQAAALTASGSAVRADADTPFVSSAQAPSASPSRASATDGATMAPTPTAAAAAVVDSTPMAAPAEAAPRTPSSQGPAAGRALVFEADTYDFGSVAHGTVAVHTYRYRNASAEPLEIVGVRSSCGCTAAEPSSRRLEPGASGELVVRFDTARKPVTGDRARMESHVYVDAAIPGQGAAGRESVRLQIGGEAVALYETTPQTGLFFASATQGSVSAPARVEVFAKATSAAGVAAPSLDVAGVQVTRVPPGLEVRSVQPVERAGRRGVAIECVLGPNAPLGTFDATLLLSTGNPAQPEVVIGARSFVQPPVRAMPPRITIAEAAPTLPVIRVMAAQPIDLLAVEVVPARGQRAPFAAEIRPGGQIALVRTEPAVGPASAGASGAGGANGGALSSATQGLAGEVRILAGHPTYPLLRVPYHVLEGGASGAGSLRAGTVSVSPGQLSLGDVEPGQPRAMELQITCASGQPLALTDISAFPAGVVEVERRPGLLGPTARLLVRIRTDALEGAVTGGVRFRPRPGAEAIYVPVTARGMPQLRTDPMVLSIPSSGSGRASIERADGRPLALAGARDPSGRLEARLEAGEGGRAVFVVERASGVPAPARPAMRELLLEPASPTDGPPCAVVVVEYP